MKVVPSSSGPEPDAGTHAETCPPSAERAPLTLVPGSELTGPSWGRRGASPDAYPGVSPSPPRPTGDHEGGVAGGPSARGHGLEMSLVTAARTGDLEAYECLVRTHRDDLLRLGVWLLADGGVAQDAVQETLVLAWRRLPTLLEPQLFRAWLYQIMTRRCLQTLRQRSHHPVSLSRDDNVAAHPVGVLVADPGDGPAQQAQLTAIDTALSRALHELPSDQRDVWVLRELHHHSYAEIAQTTGAPVSTVRGRLARARRGLPAALVAWR